MCCKYIGKICRPHCPITVLYGIRCIRSEEFIEASKLHDSTRFNLISRSFDSYEIYEYSMINDLCNTVSISNLACL